MPLWTAVGIVLFAGFIAWLIGQFQVIDAKFVNIARIIILAAVVFWLFGLFFGVDLGSIRIGHGR